MQRATPVMEARQVARVAVDEGASHFVGALGFELRHEALRRGWTFRQGAASISVFELCRRRASIPDESSAAEDEAAWEVLGDGSLRLVEVLLHGTGDLARLARAADEWADALEKLVDLQPPAPQTHAPRRK